jgi:hypothetical protein
MATLLTAQDFLKLGMETARVEHWRTYKEHCNIERFTKNYGATPETCREMWADLNTLGEIDKRSKPLHLLEALRYLFKYHTEDDLSNFFGYICRTTIRTHTKAYTEKIQTLLQLKMLTFEEADDGFIFFMTVDGTHSPIKEPRPFSTIWSSHKFGGDAGVNYEIGLSISKQKLIWLYGPTPAGLKNDLEIAREALIPKLRAFRKGKPRRMLADGIYNSEDVLDVVTLKNELDSRDMEEFKDRAMARQENYNSLIHNWKVTDHMFRSHDLDEHQVCFEAVNAICCYQLDNGAYSLLDPYP